MKLFLALFAAMVCQSAAAFLQQPDSLAVTEENRAFVSELLQSARRFQCNAADRTGAEKAVFEIYRDLYDEGMLLQQKIIQKPRTGRYVTPQTSIEYGILPSDSTLNTVLQLLMVATDPMVNSTPQVLPEKLGRLLDNLVPFRLEQQQAYRKTINHTIDPFFPETVYPSDSVVYIDKGLMKRLTAFSKEGNRINATTGRERNAFLASEFSAKPTPWTQYVYWIDQPLRISAILFEDNLQRAFVNALADSGTLGWGILIKRDSAGRWQIIAAQKLYQVNM